MMTALEAPIPAEQLTIVPANEASWENLTAIFGTSDPGRCQCQRFKVLGWIWRDSTQEERTATLRAQTACGDPGAAATSGLVAYVDDDPAGWVAVEPRTAYPKLRTSRVPWTGRTEDKGDDGIWAVTCFVVRKGYRGRGLTYPLARATIDFARERGARALEAYPMITQPGKEITWGEVHVGTRQVFEDAGFKEISHPTVRRVVMRIDFERKGRRTLTDMSGREFERVEMNEARFRDVDLGGARFEWVNLSGAVLRGMELFNVKIDGEIYNLTINAVNAELDHRFPDRVKMRPTDAAGFREAWDLVERLWGGTVTRARGLRPELLHARVDGEWSFIETLRHLVFATDSWVRRVILGDPKPWDALDLPFDEMCDVPGVPRNRDVRPSLDEVLALRKDRMATVRQVIDDLTDEKLDGNTKPIAEPGWPESRSYPVRECLLCILNEEWHHCQYAERDLDALESRGGSRS